MRSIWRQAVDSDMDETPDKIINLAQREIMPIFKDEKRNIVNET